MGREKIFSVVVKLCCCVLNIIFDWKYSSLLRITAHTDIISAHIILYVVILLTTANYSLRVITIMFFI